MTISQSAGSLPDYKEKRREAEHDSSLNRPYLSSDASLGEWSTVEAHIELFKAGYNSLDDVNEDLSKGKFETFIQELVKDVPGVHGALVDILDPSRELFGIIHSEPENEAWNEGRINVAESKSPLTFLSAPQPSCDHQTYWYHCSAPWNALDFAEPEYSIVSGGMSVEQVNQELVELIADRDHLDLPDHYQYLL